MPRDDSEVTPARALRETFSWAVPVTVIGITVVLVVATVFLVGWQVAGWFQKHTIQRNYGNTVQSQQYQQTLVAEMQQHIANITGPGGLAASRASVPAGSPEQRVLRAQELNEVSALCGESANFIPGIAPGSMQMAAVVTANCLAGTPVSSPPLAPS